MDIDKDIEKEKINKEYKYERMRKLATEVIEEFRERYKDLGYYPEGDRDTHLARDVINLLKELETYKKIAEKLADKLRYERGMKQDYMFCVDVCGDNLCDVEKCAECIIDWARKEVEK